MQNRTRYAVSEVVGTILVLGIIGSSVAITLTWARPFIDDKKADVNFESATTQFNIINEIIQDIVSQGVSCNRVASLATVSGQVSIDAVGDRFVIQYSLDSSHDFNI